MRDTILELSARLFARHGYKAASLQLVADELSLTRQALYYHFGSKGDILVALFDRVMGRMEAAVDAARPEPKHPFFLTLLRAHIEVILDDPDLVAVLLHERPELAKLNPSGAKARRDAYTARFIDAYEAGRAAGQLRDVNSWTAVNALLAAANVLSSWYHPSRSPLPRAAIAQDTFDLLLRGAWLQDQPA